MLLYIYICLLQLLKWLSMILYYDLVICVSFWSQNCIHIICLKENYKKTTTVILINPVWNNTTLGSSWESTTITTSNIYNRGSRVNISLFLDKKSHVLRATIIPNFIQTRIKILYLCDNKYYKSWNSFVFYRVGGRLWCGHRTRVTRMWWRCC